MGVSVLNLDLKAVGISTNPLCLYAIDMRTWLSSLQFQKGRESQGANLVPTYSLQPS